MSGTDSTAARTLEELEALMESAFQAGDVGETALLCWESMVRFPESCAVARIFTKKLLRDPEVAGIPLETFKSNAKELREAGEANELAQLSALGLLRFPAQRYLTLSLLDAGQTLGRKEWLRPAVKALGEPKDDDIVLLNAVASLENEEGNYERANELFRKLHRLEPNNETIVRNLSASMVGMGRYEDAVELLESYLPAAEEPREYVQRLAPLYGLSGFDVEGKIAELDNRLFASCSSLAKARVHVDLQLFLQNMEGMAQGLHSMLEYKWDPGIAFDLAEVEIARGQLEAGLERYRVRFEAFPYLEWFTSDLPPYEGQQLDSEVLLLWGEQGIGDEIMFSMFLQTLEPLVKNVVVACDKRLMHVLKPRYPTWHFLDRHDMPQQLPDADLVCPMGRLMELFLPELIDKQGKFSHPIFTPEPKRFEQVQSILSEKSNPRVAITWRGGSKTNGLIRSMEIREILSGIPDDFPIDVLSLQYDGEHEREVIDHGDSRVALSGLDNRWDLEGVFALLKCCDAVVTVDNAVAHFACALGVPTAVLIPAAQVQFRWKNQQMKQLLFPSARLFVQPAPGDWATPVNDAWQYVLNLIEAKATGELS